MKLKKKRSLVYLYREQAQNKSLDEKCCLSMSQKKGKSCVTVRVWYYPLCVFNERDREMEREKDPETEKGAEC